jgi:glycosyltransferase involved in cell wall biosynthesis
VAERVSISVLIPAYNCSKTIRAALDSVLKQTVPPDEVIVMDDGSTDDTFAILESYGSRILAIRQANSGAASARNALIRNASGDLIAFFDSDDIWHPRYLEVQCRSFRKHPNAVAFFTGHVPFIGYGAFDWVAISLDNDVQEELIDSPEFLNRYNATGVFAIMSLCCVPRQVLARMGNEPFRVSGAEDAYFCNLLPLLGGPVLRVPLPLVAYRVTGTSLSANQLKVYASLVEVFRLLEEHYLEQTQKHLVAAFRSFAASKRRTYAKILMGTGNATEARRQFRFSLRDSDNPASRAKSLALLIMSHMPRRLQPHWPTTTR